MSKVNSAPTGQALRKRLNQYEVTVEQFAAAGGLSVSSVMRALDPSRPVRLQRKTANRILRAFQILANGRRAEGRREGDVDRSDLVRGLYNTALYVLCQARGLDYDAIRRDGCHTGGAPEQMAARREAVPGVRFCVACQEGRDQKQTRQASINRRASKDSQLR